MLRDFRAFLIKENVLALAIAVIIGAALNKLVTALVDDFIMPVVSVVTPSGEWQKAAWHLGPVAFKVGDFLSALLNFLVIGFVAWRLTRLFIKPPAVAAAPVTKQCPFCRMNIDTAATRCAHCTSQL